MSATKVFGAAIAVGILGRWAANKKALPGVQGSLEVAGALILVAFLDRGRTEPIAKGFAWLFMAAVLLSDSSPLTGLVKAESAAGRIPNSSGAPGTGGGAFPGGGGGRIPNSSGAPGTGGGAFPGSSYTARATPTPRRTG